MFLTIVAFLVVLGILVLVHEFGHFVAAKWSGVKVEEFAIGFPPRIFSKTKGETRYSINAIPFGGYVKMLGELEHSSSPRAFENQSPGKRFLISIAGVTMNVVLAWFLLSVGFAAGMPTLVTGASSLPGKKVTIDIIVADVNKDSAADRAGLKSGDLLVEGLAGSDKVIFDSVASVGSFTRKYKGQSVVFKYKETDSIIEKQVKLSDSEEAPLGVALVEQSVVKVVWYKAPYVALRETYEVARVTFVMLGQFVSTFFKSGQVSQGVGGPVAVYVYSGLAIRAGAVIFIQFIATLSVNLALINILPLPALDGGRLLFIIMERIRGKKVVREEVENIIHTIGFALLIILLIAITYRDIVKFL